MPIETNCQGCGKRLRVADEHAGRLAKCPQCQQVYTVPQSAVAASWGAGAVTDSPTDNFDRWHLKTPDGLTFGPVPRAELDRWLADGRITAASQILHEGQGQWLWATQVYPHLTNTSPSPGSPFKTAAPTFQPASPFQPGASPKPGAPAGQAWAFSEASVNPYASPASPGGYAGQMRYREQHRGGAILALSIVGAIFCIFMTIAALAMSITDLGKMKQGVMDPSGRGLTIAGLVISSITLGLTALYVVVMIGIAVAHG